MHQQYIDRGQVFNYLHDSFIKYGYTPDKDTLLDVTQMIVEYIDGAGIAEYIAEE